MTPPEKARAFASMHVPGRPLVLYNIWDAGSARAVAAAGAQALATGSWSVAEAQGYADGQAMPLDVLDFVVGRIVASVNLPLSVDFEGAWSDGAAQGVARISHGPGPLRTAPHRTAHGNFGDSAFKSARAQRAIRNWNFGDSALKSARAERAIMHYGDSAVNRYANSHRQLYDGATGRRRAAFRTRTGPSHGSTRPRRDSRTGPASHAMW
jgi:hypothetical protein